MDAIYIGAIDIGGTKVAATIANAAGPLIRIVQPTVRTGPERALGDQVKAMLEEACAGAGIKPEQITRVGIGSCGPFVATAAGIGVSTPNLCGGLSAESDLPNDWKVIPLEAVLHEIYGEVVIRNDCVAALSAERAFGAVRDEPNCIYVTWSTGIGFGLCVDGRILLGKQGNAGHAGHMLLSEKSDAACGCGNYGDVESLISGRNIERRFEQKAIDIFAAAKQGSPHESAIIKEAAGWFGRALYNLAATLDTHVFVIGGSVWLHHGAWLEPMVRNEIETRLPALTQGVQIRCAELGSLAADIGALSLVMPADWINAWRQTAPWHRLAE